MKVSKYIPGFDWFRIFGCIIVLLTHHGIFINFDNKYPNVFALLYIIVPLFLMISGYLAERHYSKDRIIRYVIKYGTIYMILETCVVFYLHLVDMVSFGRFNFIGFIIYTLKCLVRAHEWTYQLWFMPALLYPMLLNAYLNRSGRKIVIAITTVLTILVTIIGKDSLTLWLDALLARTSLIGMVFHAEELYSMIVHYLTGFLFTTLGFEIPHIRIRPLLLSLILLPLVYFELSVCYLGIAKILLSILCFNAIILKIPGQFLYKYRADISFFSGTLYFLHTLEQRVISRFITENIIVSIALIIIFHLLLTLFAHHMRNTNHQKAVKQN